MTNFIFSYFLLFILLYFVWSFLLVVGIILFINKFLDNIVMNYLNRIETQKEQLLAGIEQIITGYNAKEEKIKA